MGEGGRSTRFEALLTFFFSGEESGGGEHGGEARVAGVTESNTEDGVRDCGGV